VKEKRKGINVEKILPHGKTGKYFGEFKTHILSNHDLTRRERCRTFKYDYYINTVVFIYNFGKS
jgi:hypothetical protein